MALSGVERLLTYARDLGVEPARGRLRPATASPAEQTTAPRAASSDGVKLELSSAAAEATGAGKAEQAAASAEDAQAGTTVPAAPGTALDAYQRNAAPSLGQRIAIRA